MQKMNFEFTANSRHCLNFFATDEVELKKNQKLRKLFVQNNR